MEYFVNEGNKIGFMPTEFNSTGGLVEKKLVAAEAITKGQVVAIYDSLKVKIATAATAENVIGVAMFDAATDEPVVVETEGLFVLKAGGTITAPVKVSAGDAGVVVAQTAGSQLTTGEYTYTPPTRAIGIALEDASENDEVLVKFSI